MPEALATRPILKRWNIQYVDAFNALSPARSHTESPQPLRFSDIIAYGRLVGIAKADDLLSFYRIVQMCDREYLQYHADQKQAEAKD